ncbi:hypothetical protein NIB75_00175 [Bacteroides uniformis]|nr:hypothetical protein [Bacteroides uniformis]
MATFRCSIFGGEGGGTVSNRDGKLRKLALKNEQMISAAVYGDFHPRRAVWCVLV